MTSIPRSKTAQTEQDFAFLESFMEQLMKFQELCNILRETGCEADITELKGLDCFQSHLLQWKSHLRVIGLESQGMTIKG